MDLETLLKELLLARGPGGQEDEVRTVCQRELSRWCDSTQTDKAGNLLGLIRAQDKGDPETSIRVMAHLDEIAMIVKKVRPDGNLDVVALGGAKPVSFGVCPVDILAGETVLPGVLSYGSMHNSGSSASGRDVLAGDVQWGDVYVVTRKPKQAL